LKNDEFFLVNYSDGLSDAPLADMIARLKASDKIGCFLAVYPARKLSLS
jgi:glucose-1-phosphate cytidylyltransferase